MRVIEVLVDEPERLKVGPAPIGSPASLLIDRDGSEAAIRFMGPDD
jgi:hypothetical protein